MNIWYAKEITASETFDLFLKLVLEGFRDRFPLLRLEVLNTVGDII